MSVSASMVTSRIASAPIPNATMPANYTTSAFKLTSGTARAELIMEIDGDVVERVNSGARVDKGDWTDNNAAIVAADWEVQVTKTGDTVSGSAVGSYISMASERAWYVDAIGPSTNTKSGVLTVTIREIANTANNATATITLTANFEA